MSLDLIREGEKVFQRFVELQLAIHRFPETMTVTSTDCYSSTYDPVSICAL